MRTSPSALCALAIHLEAVTKNARSHGGHGWTYDEEIEQLRLAAEDLQDLADLEAGRRVILPKNADHARKLMAVASAPDMFTGE